MKRSFLYLTIFCLTILAASAVVLYLQLPDVRILKKSYPYIIYQGGKKPPRVEFSLKKPAHWIGIEQISKVALGAILVSEDWTFYQHLGFDLSQIKEAMEENWNAKKIVRGASTITQQVAKNLYLTKNKNLWRKLKEFCIAIALEKHFKKKKILEIYLNIIELGKGIYGVGFASQYYFTKDPLELNAKEGAFLAMLLPSPKRYSKSFEKGKLTLYASQVIESILKKMKMAGYLSVEEFEEMVRIPLSFERITEEDLTPF